MPDRKTNRIAEESALIRFPKGTLARIEAARGDVRQSDYLRNLVLRDLDRVERLSAKASPLDAPADDLVSGRPSRPRARKKDEVATEHGGSFLTKWEKVIKTL